MLLGWSTCLRMLSKDWRSNTQRLSDVLLTLRFLQLKITSRDVLFLEVVEVFLRLEVDVVTELWPRDVLQEVDVTLFLSR